MNILLWVMFLILIGFTVNAQVLNSKNLTCSSSDFDALKGFMNGMETAIDGWTGGSSNCCNWVGITCSSFSSLGLSGSLHSAKVVKLELPNRRLVGHLDDSLASLDQLRTLNLSYNSLQGRLPISLFHLFHLEILDITANHFSESLPSSTNLPSIKVLVLSDNNFEGPVVSGICCNYTGIQILNLGNNRFDGSVPQELGKCISLEQLSLHQNLLSGAIPEYLFKLPRLARLTLQDNMFTSLPSIRHPSSNLEYFDVSSNRLSGRLPDFFHLFPNLSYFFAQYNNLSGEIPSSLSNSPSISFLLLEFNSLRGSVHLNCSAMSSLVALGLGFNEFSGFVPDNLPSCQKLQTVNLGSNKFTGQIPETFKKFHSLSYLSLSLCSLNNLSGSLEILQQCKNLTTLALSGSFDNEEMPSGSNLQFKVLRTLTIPDCKLTGTIPGWLSSLTQLQLLDLSWNHLTGSIPPYFGDFQSLFYLDLSNNSLSGEIPKNLTQLPAFISLFPSEDSTSDFVWSRSSNTINGNLMYNHITAFPPLLDLSSNSLTGSIWPEFGNLKNLYVLDLKHNYLSGAIPSALAGMKNIETLDLSHNNLTGTIPPSLVYLTFLSKFSVAYNHLRGVIPDGGQFSTFTDLSFEGNQGLCSSTIHGISSCENRMSPQEPKNRKRSITTTSISTSVLLGFTPGFLLAIIIWNFVPVTREKMNTLLQSCIHHGTGL